MHDNRELSSPTGHAGRGSLARTCTLQQGINTIVIVFFRSTPFGATRVIYAGMVEPPTKLSASLWVNAKHEVLQPYESNNPMAKPRSMVRVRLMYRATNQSGIERARYCFDGRKAPACLTSVILQFCHYQQTHVW